MKKYKNLGSDVGFILNGKTLDFQNGEVKELPDDFKEQIQGHLEKIVDMTPKKSTGPGTPITVVAEFPLTPKPVEIPKHHKKCENCGKIYKYTRKDQRFCSRKCYNEWRKKT